MIDRNLLTHYKPHKAASPAFMRELPTMRPADQWGWGFSVALLTCGAGAFLAVYIINWIAG